MHTPSIVSCPGARFVAILASVASLASTASAQIPVVIQCDGSDVHSTLQTAANADDDTYILLTAGECWIDQTVRITNREGVRIEGEGWNRTVLVWHGDGGSPMFSVQNSSGVSFAHFGTSNLDNNGGPTYHLESAFDVYNACFAGIEDDGDTTCDSYVAGDGPGSHGNSFESLRIGACHDGCANCCRDSNANTMDYGIRILLHPFYIGAEISGDECGVTERADCDNGGHRFTDVYVRHAQQSAFVIEGKNSIGNVFTNCRGGLRFHYADFLPGDDPASFWGRSVVRTGREELFNSPARPAGSFSWYGGLSNGAHDAVFVIGPNPDKVHIQGMYMEQSARLLRTYESGLDTSGGVTIESVRFDTTAMPEYFLDGNEYGLVVDMRSSASLTMRGNDIGERGMVTADDEPLEPENAAICWSFPAGEDDADAASFVFVGNSFGTDNENPFHPTDGSQHMDECIYPTTQHSNLIATGWVNDQDPWEPMPQHFSTLDASQSDTFSVTRRPTSHTYFNVDGVGAIRCLEGGYAGQRIVLIGQEEKGFTEIDNADGAGLIAHLPGQCSNLVLANGASAFLSRGSTLTLVKGEDGLWYELSRRAPFM